MGICQRSMVFLSASFWEGSLYNKWARNSPSDRSSRSVSGAMGWVPQCTVSTSRTADSGSGETRTGTPDTVVVVCLEEDAE